MTPGGTCSTPTCFRVVRVLFSKNRLPAPTRTGHTMIALRLQFLHVGITNDARVLPLGRAQAVGDDQLLDRVVERRERNIVGLPWPEGGELFVRDASQHHGGGR